jgi:hypothetical protein
MQFSLVRASTMVACIAVGFASGLAGAQAPNDFCANAIPVTTGGITGNNNASSVGPDPVPACGTMSNDVWYSYTATCTGTVTATLCTATTNFDTLMAAWGGSCGCLSELACNDDFCPGNKSSVTFNAVVGTTYYISVGGYDGGAGNFGLNITCTPMNPPPFIPLNDHCAAPQVIAEGVPTAGTTQNSTTGGGGPCPGDPVGTCSVMSNDVWYAFQATCTGAYEARTCASGTDFDTVVAVWDGTGGCGALVEVGCNDTGGCTLPGLGNAAVATWNATAGTLYYVSVGGFIGLTGNFGLVVGPTGANPVLSFFDVGPGTIGYTVTGGPPLGLALTAITTFAGAYPNGPFFGVDMTIQQVVDQLNFGYPFLTPLGSCGDAVIGPFFGAPSGITLYAVTVTAQSGTVTLHSNSAPVSATIP